MLRYRIALSAGFMAAGSFLLPFHGALAQGKSHSAKAGHVPPGQAKKTTGTTPTPPGQAKPPGRTVATPPGQAKKNGGG